MNVYLGSASVPDLDIAVSGASLRPLRVCSYMQRGRTLVGLRNNFADIRDYISLSV